MTANNLLCLMIGALFSIMCQSKPYQNPQLQSYHSAIIPIDGPYIDSSLQHSDTTTYPQITVESGEEYSTKTLEMIGDSNDAFRHFPRFDDTFHARLPFEDNTNARFGMPNFLGLSEANPSLSLLSSLNTKSNNMPLANTPTGFNLAVAKSGNFGEQVNQIYDYSDLDFGAAFQLRAESINTNDILDFKDFSETIKTPFSVFTNNSSPSFPTSLCSPPVFQPLGDRVSNASIPPHIQQAITYELDRKATLRTVLAYNYVGRQAVLKTEEDSDLSCPSSFSKARLFFRYGNRCWILQSTENQDSVFYANCKCSECLSPAGVSQPVGSACEPYAIRYLLYAYCEARWTPLNRIAQEVVNVPVACRCRHSSPAVTQTLPPTSNAPSSEASNIITSTITDSTVIIGLPA